MSLCRGLGCVLPTLVYLIWKELEDGVGDEIVC
jgi:hypothetical protein